MRNHTVVHWTLALTFAVAGLAAAGEAESKLPAFPGAEGYGAASIGGRGGKVVKVTNLNAKGPGSFRHAIEEVKGPRIIVFDVAGVIPGPQGNRGSVTIKDSHVTIAGQTAPYPGITFEGLLAVQYRRKPHVHSDVTIRFLRVRPNFYRGGGEGGDCMQLSGTDRLIVDHCSVSWGNDELVDLGLSADISVQWTTIEESDIRWEGGDEPHNFGLILWGSPGRFSIHHTFFAHHHTRTPLAGGKGPIDVRNTVVYNCGTTVSGAPGNTIGNYCKKGPGAIWGFPRIYHPVGTLTMVGISTGRRGGSYVKGNYVSWGGGYIDPPNDVRYRRPAGKGPVPVPNVTTHTAEEAYRLIEAHGGCLPRDAVTKRTLYEMRTGTGSWGRHQRPGGLLQGFGAIAKAPADDDNDGMPNQWEKAHGLDPGNPSDGNKIVPAGASAGDRHKGYTYIEYYINERADTLIAQAMTEARLNKTSDWKPAKPDVETLLKPMAELVKDITSQDMNRKKTDTGASFYAIQNLSRIGAKARAAVPDLAAAMDTEDVRKACFVAWGIGAIGPNASEAVPALIKALERPYPVSNTKWRFNPHGFIAWALGRIGPDAKAAVPALAKALHGKDGWARRPAAWALGRIGPDAKGAIKELIAALKYTTGGGWKVLGNAQEHAADALARIGEPAVAALIDALDDRDDAVRRGAVMALGRIGPDARPAAPQLIKLLADKQRLIRAEAATALGKIDPSARTATALAGVLSDPEFGVRHAAAKALGKCGPAAKAAVPALATVLTDEKKEVRRAAFAALGSIGKDAVGVLSKALGNRADAWNRKHAARALGDARDGADALAKALSEKNPEVRREAVWSLALVGPRAAPAADVLAKAQEDEDYVVRVAARAALERVTGK